jgi:hypothetical protein
MLTRGQKQKLEQVREAYGKIETVDPDGFAYKCLISWLDMQNDDMLQALVECDIRFVSRLAQNRLSAYYA